MGSHKKATPMNTKDDTAEANFEDLLAELGAGFVNVSPDVLDQRINEALQRIVLFLGVDRSSVAQINKTAPGLRITHSWAVEGIDPLPPELDGSNFPYLSQTMQEGNNFVVSDITKLPDEARVDREFALSIGLKSVAVVPMQGAGEFLGLIAFGAIRKPREWPTQFVQRLGLVAEIIANALLQRQKELELNRVLDEVSELKERLEAENVVWREKDRRDRQTETLVGKSPAFLNIINQVDLVARTDSTVLILGETGTGKELIANAVHQRSSRANNPVIRVNCAALPSDLIESELFGHEKGSFTGAISQNIGRFELAHGGTIVLDEIGELPGDLQAKLLRVLQSGEFERVGSARTRHADTRVIASTNRDLRKMTTEGTFRSDLYYRLQVFPITVPALRERQDDIPLLAAYLVEKLRIKMGKKINHIPADLMSRLKQYNWPGNVRELENIIERSLIVSTGTSLVLEGLPALGAPSLDASMTEVNSSAPTIRPLQDIEREYIRSVCVLCHWKIHGKGNAADLLCINPNTLRSRMKKLEIERPV